jgi:hypothetical protein
MTMVVEDKLDCPRGLLGGLTGVLSIGKLAAGQAD